MRVATLGTTAVLLILAACGGSGGSSSPPPSATATPATPVIVEPEPLRADATAAGRWIGAAVKSAQLDEAAFAGTFARHFDYVTAEYEMKWDPLQRQPGVYDFAGADRIVDFAQRNGQRIKGHALVWHQSLPDWVARLSATELRAAMTDHIRTVVGRYRGRIAVWDVVNEAVADDGVSLRDTVFLQKLGESYIETAFQIAHEADPGAILVYNDYGAEGASRKSDRVYELVRGLKDRGIPIHGVGLQMHVAAQNRPSSANIAANLKRLGDLGLLVNLSEMDVRIRELPGDLATRLEVQRREYRDIVGLCVAEVTCQSVTFWGMTDRYSWIDAFYGPDDPLPFDEAYNAKPAFFGIQDALRRR